MDSEQMKAHELHEATEANDRGATLIGRDDYELLLTLLSDELGADSSTESMHAMLLTWQARLVEARRWRNVLTDIANADGDECHVMSSLRYIGGYHEGVKTQAQRAKSVLGEGAPPEYPANLLLSLIERYTRALDEILERANGVNHSQDTRVYIGGVIEDIKLIADYKKWGKLPSAEAITWGERKLTELGLLDSADTTDDTKGGA